ncbi:phosphopantetheine-binding protein [Embleya sp. NPDC005575]|uniref:phosphopantetheine-binding protein n=1 Tax=Embleya sp. NPDC005575 TaxID=3156892 RepID=UPI0033BED42C
MTPTHPNPAPDHMRALVLATARTLRPDADITATTALDQLGLDSLDRLALAVDIEHTTGFALPDAVLADATTLDDLVTHLTHSAPRPTAHARRTDDTAPSTEPVPDPGGRNGDRDRDTDPWHTHRDRLAADTTAGTGFDGPGRADPGSLVGDGSRLWHQAQVATGARIGADCVVGKGAYIGTGSVLGDRVKIGNHASVFGARVADAVMICPGALLLEDAAARATTPDGRRKGPDDFDRTPVTVESGATVGAGAVVAPGVRIGRHAMVALGAVVAHDVPDHALVAGNPARPCGWACACGHTLDADLVCPHCARAHRHRGTGLTEVTPRE